MYVYSNIFTFTINLNRIWDTFTICNMYQKVRWHRTTKRHSSLWWVSWKIIQEMANLCWSQSFFIGRESILVPNLVMSQTSGNLGRRKRNRLCGQPQPETEAMDSPVDILCLKPNLGVKPYRSSLMTKRKGPFDQANFLVLPREVAIWPTHFGGWTAEWL